MLQTDIQTYRPTDRPTDMWGIIKHCIFFSVSVTAETFFPLHYTRRNLTTNLVQLEVNNPISEDNKTR